MRFGLGSCSRLESTHKVPAVGQKFYWSGVPKEKDIICIQAAASIEIDT